MEEKETIFYDDDFENTTEYQRHSMRTRRGRSKPDRDEKRFNHARKGHKGPTKKKRKRRTDQSGF